MSAPPPLPGGPHRFSHPWTPPSAPRRADLPEAPIVGMRPLPADAWSETPILQANAAAGRSLLLETATTDDPLLTALGCTPAHAPASPTTAWRHERRIGAVLACLPLLPADVAHRWGFRPHLAHRERRGGAPLVFRVRRRVVQIGPWRLTYPLESGYAALAPAGCRILFRAAGWYLHAETGLFWSRNLRQVAALAAWAEPPVRERLVGEGVPDTLLDALRFAPALLPWKRQKWILIANRSEADGFEPPPGGWRSLEHTGWQTTSAADAHAVARFAPRPLADLLAEAAENQALARVSPSHARILATPDTPGRGALPTEKTKPILRWCARHDQVVALVPIPGETLDPCPDAHCRCAPADAPGAPLRSLSDDALWRHRALAEKRAWRMIGWRSIDPADNAEPPVDDAAIDATVPRGRALRPGQRDGIRFMLERKIAINATVMAGGKTIMALLAVNHWLRRDGPAPRGRVLILCPAYLRDANWAAQARVWLAPHIARLVVRDPHQPLPEAGVLIASYHRLTHWPAFSRWTGQGPLTALVTDEGHHARNASNQRTRALLDLDTERWTTLTGTPIMDRPVDLHPVLARLAPRAFARRKDFAWAFRVADPAHRTAREQTLCEELAHELRRTVLYRPPEEEVLADVPEPWPAQILEVDVPDGAAIGAREEALLARAAQAPEERLSVFAQVRKLQREAAQGKLPALRESLRAIAARGGAPLIFTLHKDMARAAHDIAWEENLSCGLVTGDATAAERDRAVESFRAGALRALALTIAQASEGLNLEQATHVVFHELDWTPAPMKQAAARAQRPGRTTRLHVLYLIARHTLDARAAALITGKEAIITGALGDDPVEAQLARLEKRAARPAQNPATDPDAPPPDPPQSTAPERKETQQ